jgi:hypothetical protein
MALSFLGASGLAFAGRAHALSSLLYCAHADLLGRGLLLHIPATERLCTGGSLRCSEESQISSCFSMDRDRAGPHPPGLSLSGAVLANLGDALGETATHHHSRNRSRRPELARLLPLRRQQCSQRPTTVGSIE